MSPVLPGNGKFTDPTSADFKTLSIIVVLLMHLSLTTTHASQIGSEAHLRPPSKKCHRSTATGCRRLSELHFQIAQKWLVLHGDHEIEHLLCQTSSACLNRRNTHSRGFYTIACLEKYGCHRDSA